MKRFYIAVLCISMMLFSACSTLDRTQQDELIPVVTEAFRDNSPRASFRVITNFGEGNDEVTLDRFIFAISQAENATSVTRIASANSYILYAEDDADDHIFGQDSLLGVVFDLSDFQKPENRTLTSDKKYIITAILVRNESVSLTLLGSGIEYTIDGISRTTNTLDDLYLGSMVNE